MTPAKRLATIVLDSLEHPHRLFNGDMERLARLVLRKSSRSPAVKFKGPTRTGTKVKRRRATAKTTAEIREKVLERAEWKCERCRDWIPTTCGHLHHLLGGNGRRLQQQSVDTCVWVCADCHRWLHANPKAARVWGESIIHPAF